MTEASIALRRAAEFIDKMERLSDLSARATPGPWIRKWASTDVHHMGGDDALRSQEDIDFAVASVNFVRDLMA